MSFDLSQNKALRTLEISAESIVNAGVVAPGFLKTVLSSVTSPGMLDVIIIYSYPDFGAHALCGDCTDPVCLPHRLEPHLLDFPQQLVVFRKMHGARSFRLTFCVDVHGNIEDLSVWLLESAVREEEANGGFKYLASRPVITCERRTVRTRPEDYHAGATSEWIFASAL